MHICILQDHGQGERSGEGPGATCGFKAQVYVSPVLPGCSSMIMHSCRVSRHRRGTTGGMSSRARLCSATLLACAAILLLGPQHGHGQGLLLGSQLGSTPSLGRLLDPGTLTTPAAVSNTAAGADSTTAAGADSSTDGERSLQHAHVRLVRARCLAPAMCKFAVIATAHGTQAHSLACKSNLCQFLVRF